MKNLYINKASYVTGDDNGNKVLLNVNYWEGKFGLEVITYKNDNIKVLQNDARELARDLIKRKSRVNFAK